RAPQLLPLQGPRLILVAQGRRGERSLELRGPVRRHGRDQGAARVLRRQGRLDRGGMSSGPVGIEWDGGRVSGLLELPARARALLVLAHGAGAGMAHPFMAAAASGLAERGVATLRYQFPYMERGAKRPDTPGVAQATVRAAVENAARLAPGLPLFAGGKSFGGRMTSQAQSESPLPGVRGLAFLGFPLHAPGKASD